MSWRLPCQSEIFLDPGSHIQFAKFLISDPIDYMSNPPRIRGTDTQVLNSKV